MTQYGSKTTEAKWQQKWEETKLYETDLKDTSKPPYYNLVMFPYPSGDKLHIGHWYNFAPADSWGRFMRMKGYNVFEPMGFDAFGLPAENYAIKTGIHPSESIKTNTETMTQQLKRIGTMYDWSKTLNTSTPEYYRWTQWLFLQLYKKGLAYRKKAPVNWCPSCQTVLANEQVVDGHCERCKHEVTKKELVQWFFRIRDYAEQLLDFEGLDWPEKTKLMQQHWIGKSEGTEVYFPVDTKYNYVLIHGYKANSQSVFFPWLKEQLEKYGHQCTILDLPNSENPTETEQVEHVLQHATFDENTVVLGHSLGAVVAMKVVEKIGKKIAGLVLVGGFMNPNFRDFRRPFDTAFDWNFDVETIKNQIGFIKILSDVNDYAIPLEQGQLLQRTLGGELIELASEEPHFIAIKEPAVLDALLPRIKVFTTRVDTLYSAAFITVAPEHPLVEQITTQEQRKEILDYREQAKKETDIVRSSLEREKTGVFTGSYAFNPITGEKIPIWVGDFVLMHYGTGAIFGDAHDERDFIFAKKYQIPLKTTIKPADTEDDSAIRNLEVCFSEDGILYNSQEFDGLTSAEARPKITAKLESIDAGKKVINYKLRDWLISRQRYWGAPIPIVYDPEGNAHPIPEEHLPWLLPVDVEFKPTGTSPLAQSQELIERTEKIFGPDWRPEVDTMDTFMCSSFYYLRYLMGGQPSESPPLPQSAESSESSQPSASSNQPALQAPSDKALAETFIAPSIEQHWMPVHMYIGGPEHACMHLIYARFFMMALKDMGYVSHKEPFKKLVHQGFITNQGSKMSKSKGNVVSPDEFVEEYGSDVFRMYLMFMGPFTEGGDWSDKGITGIARFVQRFYTLITSDDPVKDERGAEQSMHRTIKKVTEDIENMQFNTAIAALMEFVNTAQKTGLSDEAKRLAVLLIAPLAPHLAEELWSEHLAKNQPEHCIYSVFNQSWPQYDPKAIQSENLTLAIQVNGKLRAQMEVATDAEEETIFTQAFAEAGVKKYTEGKEIVKKIYVPGKLVSIVVKD